jgi:multidrug resistance efflux pump
MEMSRNLKLSSLDNKLEQLRRKVTSDSAELVAAEIDHGIAVQQLTRAKQMISEGIIALTEFERRTAQYNKVLALLTEKQQKLQNTKLKLINLRYF